MMEGALSYDNQLYFNALYFPAQTILMTVGFLYKPLLTRMADAWNDPARRRRFDLFILASLGVIVAITLIGVALMRWIGIDILGFLYGLDFEPFRAYSYLMLVAGGITGGIDFLYQVVTVMRRQAVVTKLYLITFVFALVVPYMLIQVSGLEGAVLSYVIVMGILFVLLSLEYVGVRLGYMSSPADAMRPRSGADGRADPAGMSAREAARAERVAREGGEVDAKYAAYRSLRQRQERRDGSSGLDAKEEADVLRRSAARQPATLRRPRPSIRDGRR